MSSTKNNNNNNLSDVEATTATVTPQIKGSINYVVVRLFNQNQVERGARRVICTFFQRGINNNWKWLICCVSQQVYFVEKHKRGGLFARPRNWWSVQAFYKWLFLYPCARTGDDVWIWGDVQGVCWHWQHVWWMEGAAQDYRRITLSLANKQRDGKLLINIYPASTLKLE